MAKKDIVICLITGALVLLTPCVVAAGDQPVTRNHAAESELPRGQGIAADYPGDARIESQPDVIFADNFEVGRFEQKWDSVRNDDGDVVSVIERTEIEPRLGRRSLQVKATLGKNTGGGLTKWFRSSETVFVRFYVRFDPTCDYVHHFCTLRANRSLQGKDRWSGFGGAGVKPNGDERFSTALEPWGNWGRWPPPGRWNFYSYWHEMTRSPDGKYWGNGFRPESQPNIVRDGWICAEFMLKHNTPGKGNGEQAYWIDGQLRAHWKGINWRTVKELQANALTLEAYVTDRWTKNETNIVCFDNVVFARRYIGPTPAD